MKCSTCQHENRESAKFCDNCGNALPVLCPNCGSSNRPSAKFCDNCGTKLNSGEEISGETSSSQTLLSKFIPKELVIQLETARAARAMQGERRVVTILFCDVKGSTAAAEQLDPEEWTEIMNGAFEYMIHPVYLYEGTIARLMGDAILAFFGAPIAHEDDHQRAVLAAMKIISDIKPYREKILHDWGIDFNVRVGINTGLVVVGAVGSDLRMEYTAMGDAINLAARMEQTADPGTVQVAEDTHKLIAPLFDFKALGKLEVKGKAEPIKTYRPLKIKNVPDRLRGIEGLDSPLIGRAQEKELLEDNLKNLGKGIGGIICLIGEAGLGKSRLLKDVRHSNESQTNYQWFETYSLSYETEQPYGLIRRLMRRVFAITSDDDPEKMHTKIHHAVQKFPFEESTQAWRVFDSLFGLASATGEPPLEGETFKGLLYNVMKAWWQHRSQAEPVVLICDDVHWSDPASIALLQHLFQLSDQTAILLVFAMRLERETPGWQALQVAANDFPHHYTEIHLRSLSADESNELVDSLLRISDLPADFRTRIKEKSEGNPYFIEEVVRSLIDQGLVAQGESGTHWHTTDVGSDFDIPGSIKNLLVARMDRLNNESRRILQVASVIGRSFYFRILEVLVDLATD